HRVRLYALALLRDPRQDRGETLQVDIAHDPHRQGQSVLPGVHKTLPPQRLMSRGAVAAALNPSWLPSPMTRVEWTKADPKGTMAVTTPARHPYRSRPPMTSSHPLPCPCQ